MSSSAAVSPISTISGTTRALSDTVGLTIRTRTERGQADDNDGRGQAEKLRNAKDPAAQAGDQPERDRAPTSARQHDQA